MNANEKIQLADGLIKSCEESISEAESRCGEMLNLLEILHQELKDTEVNMTTTLGAFHITSTDVGIMLQIARRLGRQVEKRYNDAVGKGYMIIHASNRICIFSAYKALPRECKVEKVVKTYTEYKPIGDCGSWFGEDSVANSLLDTKSS